MKTLKVIGIVLLVIIALVLIIPLFLPSSYYVVRTVDIEKPASFLFKAATDYTLRKEWDPWLSQEPTAEVNVENVEGIVGSWYEWKGEKIGSGRMEILEVEIPTKITASLRFIEPFESESTVLWEFHENDGVTAVHWGFKGTAGYPLERIFLMNIDGQIGPDFEKGLASFKEMVEKMVPQAKTSEVEETTLPEIKALVIKSESGMDKLSEIMEQNFGKLMSFVAENGIQTEGYPFSNYISWDEAGNTVFETGIPVNAKVEGKGEIYFSIIKPLAAIKVKHWGPYEALMQSYDIMMKYLEDNGYEMNGPTLEIYITDPQMEPDQSKWETHIYIPFK